jgi:hypothetical protein
VWIVNRLITRAKIAGDIRSRIISIFLSHRQL